MTIPLGATIAEAVAALSQDKSVEELRDEKARISDASSRQNEAAKRLLSSKPTEVHSVAAQMRVVQERA